MQTLYYDDCVLTQGFLTFWLGTTFRDFLFLMGAFEATLCYCAMQIKWLGLTSTHCNVCGSHVCRICQNKHMREENTELHPRLCSPPPSAPLWVCEGDKQCCPAEPEHYSGVRSEMGAWKEEGWVVFRSRVAFPVQQCVGRPRRAHRHAIPSPTDIILQQAGTQRGQGRHWGQRGRRSHRETFQTEEKEGGGCRKVWASQQYEPDTCHFSNPTKLTDKWKLGNKQNLRNLVQLIHYLWQHFFLHSVTPK